MVLFGLAGGASVASRRVLLALGGFAVVPYTSRGQLNLVSAPAGGGRRG